MPIGDNLPTQSGPSFLVLFEPPPQLIEPAVRALLRAPLFAVFLNLLMSRLAASRDLHFTFTTSSGFQLWSKNATPVP